MPPSPLYPRASGGGFSPAILQTLILPEPDRRRMPVNALPGLGWRHGAGLSCTWRAVARFLDRLPGAGRSGCCRTMISVTHAGRVPQGIDGHGGSCKTPAKARLLVAPSRTIGAMMPLLRGQARKVVVFQCPYAPSRPSAGTRPVLRRQPLPHGLSRRPPPPGPAANDAAHRPCRAMPAELAGRRAHAAFEHAAAARSRKRQAERQVLQEKEWCPGTDLNRRHADFQSAALPTELPGRPCGGG